MPAEKPFRGLFAEALRAVLPLLTGQETKVFLALVSYTNDAGMCYPGLRELSAITTYPPPICGELVLSLQAKNLIVIVRQSERDITGRMLPDVYAVNPDLLLCSIVSTFKHALTYRHSSMPVTSVGEEFAQADRITEAESVELDAAKQNYSTERAATLQKTHTPQTTRNAVQGVGQNAAGQRQLTGGNRPNSPAQRHTPPPSSAASPSRDLTFQEGIVANAVRRQIKDMSAETVKQLIIEHGAEKVNEAVLSCLERMKKAHVARPTGWIIGNLKSGAKK